jgi:hypothetical protein
MIQVHKSIPFFLAAIAVSSALALPTSAETSRSKHRVAEGTLELKRPGASNFRRAGPNTQLQPGDLLKPASGSRVRILCDNGEARFVPPGTITGVNSLCPQPRPPSKNGRVQSRSGLLDIPYPISPRATLLLTSEPTLRWNAAPGAENFTVTVRTRSFEWSEQVSRNAACEEETCALVYSGPPLEPGVGYKLVIKTDTGRSSEEDSTGGLGFELMGLEQRQEVQTIAQRIEEQDLSEGVKLIALADLYADFNLIAEAIELLEAAAETEPLAALYRRLGDLYLTTGLAREAEVQYLEAIQLAREVEEREEKALAQVGLSQVSEALNRREEAIRWLQEALAEYEQLGETQQSEELQERLERLQL